METKSDGTVRYLVRGDATQAEVRLLVAILEEAISCFRKCLLARDKKRRQLFRDAETWIMREDTCRPFSFDHICDVLGINAAYLRRLLRQWRDQQFAERGLVRHTAERTYLRLAGDQEGATEISAGRRERRTFTNEFKAETARLVSEGGRHIRAVARELDLNASVVWRWVQETGTAEAAQASRHGNRSRIQVERTAEAPDSLAKKIA